MARVKFGELHQKPQLDKLFKINSSATDARQDGKTCCVQVGKNLIELECGGIDCLSQVLDCHAKNCRNGGREWTGLVSQFEHSTS